MNGLRLRAIISMALVCLFLPALASVAAAGSYSVACVGDSITENRLASQLKPMLQNATGDTWTTYDHGIGGYTTHDLRDAMSADCWWCSRPTYTLIMAGTNDMVHFYGLDSSVGAMQDMINMMRRGSSKVVVAFILPSLSLQETDWAKSYNQRMRERLVGVDYFMETNWNDFYDPNTDTAKGVFMGDRIHPNDTGYDMIADNWFQVILSAQADPFTEKVNNYR
ncbi:hypothetical protein AAU61_15670 [Desulfocarbo indianensis]|nr:hypothetical protein AAU61_15670 [Desulfocarbo indianensis]